MNELTITNRVPATITFDKTKAINEVKANLTVYYDEEGKFIPLNEDNLAQSKKERAALVKVAKAFNAKQIAVKKELSAEITQFETDVKEVIQVVKDTQVEFDIRIKASESRIDTARQLEITSWNEYKDINEFVSFQSDWLKKSWKDDKKLKLELMNIKTQIDQALSSIKMFATSHNLNADKYVELFKTTPLDIVQQRIIEDHNLISEVNDIKPVKAVVMDTTAPITTITRELTGTIEQLKMLKAYAIDKLNIKWEESK